MAKIDDFLMWVIPRVPNCPRATARTAIIDAMIEFCEQSLAWSALNDAQPLINKIATYSIDVPTGARLVLVRDVYAANYKLEGKPLDEIAVLMPDWQSQTGMPLYYNMLDWDAGELRLYPAPSVQVQAFVSVRAAFAPAFNAVTVPDFLLNRYYRAISAGACATLLSMADQPWANPNTAAQCAADFEQRKFSARAEVLHDGVAGSLRVTPRAFR